MSGLSTASDLIDLMGIPLSDEQIEAITAPMAPGVIIAGAGTGKTTVMTARVVWLVGRGEVPADKVLGLTFTRKAAGELAKKVRECLASLHAGSPHDDELGYPQISTYDSFASSLVTEFGAWEGIGPGNHILSDAERFLLADQVVRSLPQGLETLVGKSLPWIDAAMLTLEASVQSHLVTDERVVAYTQKFIADLDQAPLYRGKQYQSVLNALTTARTRLDLLEIAQDYRQMKAREGAAEFGDQMARAVGLAGRLPIVGQIMRARYALVVVDEYQDTSAAQAHLLGRLFGAESGIEGYPVTAVGDPLQAIYTWRGAAVDNIYSFHRFFPSPEMKTYTLSMNLRSGPEILTLANRVADTVRADPLLSAGMAVELTPGPDPSPADLVVREFPTQTDEIPWIAQDLLHACGERRTPWSEVAILVRRNSEIGPIAQACRAIDIPVDIQDIGGLLSIEAISQVYAMMKLMVDPGENPCVAEILSGPRFRVELKDLSLLGRRARELARESSTIDPTGTTGDTGAPMAPVRLMDAVMDPGPAQFSSHARSSFSRLGSDLVKLRAYQASVVDQVRRIVAQIGLDTEIYASQAQARADLRRFLAHVAQYSGTHQNASMDALVAYLSAEEEFSQGLSRANPTTQNAVQILTVHRAKGLEWDMVYLPCVVDKVFPGDRLMDNPLTSADALPTAVRSDASAVPQIGEVSNTGLAEYEDQLRQALGMSEDRLAYVGLTRAKTRLVVTAHRWAEGRVTPCARSRYFEQAARLAEELGTAHLLTGDVERGGGVGDPSAVPWPGEDDPTWVDAAQAVLRSIEGESSWGSGDLPSEVVDEISSWDEIIASMSAPAPQVVDVPLPAPMSASQVMRLGRDPQGFAAQLARPVPHPVSRRAFVGSQFHAWVEQYYGSSLLIEEDYAPADERLARLCRSFETSVFSSARPCAVEQDFVTAIAGHAVSGRIDAVFRAEENPGLVPDGKTILIVDWKTGTTDPDPDQLRIYARAWASETGIGLDQIATGFFSVLDREFTQVEIDRDVSVNQILSRIPESK